MSHFTEEQKAALLGVCPRCKRNVTTLLHTCEPPVEQVTKHWFLFKLDGPVEWVPMAWDGKQWMTAADFVAIEADEICVYQVGWELACRKGVVRYRTMRAALQSMPNTVAAACVLSVSPKAISKMHLNGSWTSRMVRRWNGGAS